MGVPVAKTRNQEVNRNVHHKRRRNRNLGTTKCLMAPMEDRNMTKTTITTSMKAITTTMLATTTAEILVALTEAVTTEAATAVVMAAIESCKLKTCGILSLLFFFFAD